MILVQTEIPAAGNVQTFTNPVVAGDMLIVAFGYTIPGAAPTIADTAGTSWEPPLTNLSSDGATSIAIFYGIAQNSGPCTVTVSGGAGPFQITIFEFSGVFDNLNATAVGTGADHQTNPLTTTANHCCFFGAQYGYGILQTSFYQTTPAGDFESIGFFDLQPSNAAGAIALVCAVDMGYGGPGGLGFIFGTDMTGAAAPPPPPPAPPMPPPSGGGSGVGSVRTVNRTQFLCPPLNPYDKCLNEEMRQAAAIHPKLSRCTPRTPRSYPWVDMPEQGRPLNKAGAIPAPAPASGFVPVLTFIVQFGYEGILNALYQAFTGTLNQGSGDLTWRLQINRWYAKGFSNTAVALGSAQELYPVSGGFPLRSDQKVTYWARNNNAAAIPPGAGMVLCGVRGWVYPSE